MKRFAIVCNEDYGILLEESKIVAGIKIPRRSPKLYRRRRADAQLGVRAAVRAKQEKISEILLIFESRRLEGIFDEHDGPRSISSARDYIERWGVNVEYFGADSETLQEEYSILEDFSAKAEKFKFDSSGFWDGRL